MAQEDFSELSIIDSHMVNWRAKVVVLIKKPLKQSPNNKRTKYQKLVLSDEWGNCVDAVIYNSDIDLYEEIIHQDKAYIISNAGIDIANENFKSKFANTKYSWTINSNTTVISVPYPNTIKSVFTGNFTYYQHFIPGSLINTVVVILKGQPPRYTRTGQTITEYVGIDHEFNEIIISFWNDDGVTKETHSLMVDTNPVVALINFRVNSYYGISLSSTSSSFVVTKMEIPALLQMEEWRTEHLDGVQEKLRGPGPSDRKIGAASNINLPKITVSELMDVAPNQKYIITVLANLERIPSSFMYICCETCYKKAPVDYRNLFKCGKCNDFKFAIRRYRFCVKVEDASGKLDVTMFGQNGEKILNIDEDEFHAKYYPAWKIPKDDINSTLEGVTWTMTILKSEYNQAGSMQMSYNVENMTQEEETNSTHDISTTEVTNTREITITELIKSEPGKYAVNVEAKLGEIPSSFMYVCCDKCFCRTDVAVNAPFNCSGKNCSGYQHAIRRYRFSIQVRDTTGELMVALLGKIGEIVLDKSEDEFYKQYHPKWLVSLEDIDKKLQGRRWKMTIVKKSVKLNGRMENSFIVEDMTLSLTGESEFVNSDTNDVRNSTQDQNIDDAISVRVKLEEEEDAKKAATREARISSTKQTENEIIRIDYLEDEGTNQQPNGKKNARARGIKRKTGA